MSVPKRKQLSKATRLEVLNKYDNHCVCWVKFNIKPDVMFQSLFLLLQ